jgi:hypothetical protein
MSCYDGCLSNMQDGEKNAIFNRIRRKLGAPVMGVELVDEQIEECICESIEEYSSRINNWAMENKLAEMLGLSNSGDFTLKYITNSLYFEKSYTDGPSQMIGGGINTTRELKTGYISLSGNVQNYDIPDTHEINEIMWYTPAFINFYGLDPLSNSNIDFTEFGASFAGATLYSVMPVFDTILTTQAAKMRNKVRGNEYSYSVHKGAPGFRTIRLFPIPRNSGTTDASFGITGTLGTPGTMFYRYYERPDGYVAGNPELGLDTIGVTGQTQGNGLVSGPADAPLFNLKYDMLNDVAKTWIKKYAQALAKELLGLGIRGKFSGELPIPDASLTMNSADLIVNGRADQERFLEQLKNDLENLNLKKLLADRAEMTESVNKSLQSVPLGIYFG